MVHALGRAAGGAKLPSVGLCLNASKAESRLEGDDILTRSPVSEGSKQCDFIRRGRPSRAARRTSQWPRTALMTARTRKCAESYCTRLNLGLTLRGVRCRDSDSSADDFGTERGVVLSRAAT